MGQSKRKLSAVAKVNMASQCVELVGAPEPGGSVQRAGWMDSHLSALQ